MATRGGRDYMGGAGVAGGAVGGDPAPGNVSSETLLLGIIIVAIVVMIATYIGYMWGRRSGIKSAEGLKIVEGYTNARVGGGNISYMQQQKVLDHTGSSGDSVSGMRLPIEGFGGSMRDAPPSYPSYRNSSQLTNMPGGTQYEDTVGRGYDTSRSPNVNDAVDDRGVNMGGAIREGMSAADVDSRQQAAYKRQKNRGIEGYTPNFSESELGTLARGE